MVISLGILRTDAVKTTPYRETDRQEEKVRNENGTPCNKMADF